jgi:hypothetical protein
MVRPLAKYLGLALKIEQCKVAVVAHPIEIQQVNQDDLLLHSTNLLWLVIPRRENLRYVRVYPIVEDPKARFHELS